MKYNISKIHEIPRKSSYQGYEDIHYHHLENSEIPNIIRNEITKRIEKNENGIILYNIERFRDGKNRKKQEGHNISLQSVYLYANDIVLSTCNGDGIYVYIPFIFRENFKLNLEKEKGLKYKEIIYDNIIEHLFHIKKDTCSISTFYRLCEESGNQIVLTIGCDLLNRGISFCSDSNSEKPLATTTLIFKPSPSRHIVGIIQSIGRLLGTIRPDLERTLYAPPLVLEDYKNHCKNQENVIQKLLEEQIENSIMTNEFMENYEYDRKIHRDIDRPKLKLKPNWKKEELVEHNNEIEDLEQREIHRLTNPENGMFKKWAQVENTSNISRFMKEGLYPNKEYTKKEIEKLCKEYNITLQHITCRSIGTNSSNHYGNIIIQNKTKYILNPQLKNAFEEFF